MYDMRVNDPGIVEEVMMMTILVGVGVSSANIMHTLTGLLTLSHIPSDPEQPEETSGPVGRISNCVIIRTMVR